ncbi:MAG TPA: hypothetical protein VLU25_17345 [Acidobacteriota bacterium]|nr:hypothetical protein [Acidobacteriota bacterium]
MQDLKRLNRALRLALCFLPALLFLFIVPSGGLAAPGALDTSLSQSGTWPGPAEPLPFQTHSQVLEFLRQAEVVSAREIESGTNKTQRLKLKDGELESHAVFRTVDINVRQATQINGRFHMGYRDSYIFEVAAYRLSRMLGIDQVPPTVLREYRSQRGSFQLWIYGAISETQRRRENRQPPDDRRWTQQIQTKLLFDRLIDNFDRNLGNQLIDRNWKLWLIDHTRSFGTASELRTPQAVYWCSRTVYQALKNLDRQEVEEELADVLQSDELRALFARWDKMLEHLDSQIEKRGEEAVLF